MHGSDSKYQWANFMVLNSRYWDQMLWDGGSHQLRRDCTKQSVWGRHCAWANGPIFRRPVMHSVIIWNVGLTDSMHIQSALLQMTWSHVHLTCSESWAAKCHRHLPDNICFCSRTGSVLTEGGCWWYKIDGLVILATSLYREVSNFNVPKLGVPEKKCDISSFI